MSLYSWSVAFDNLQLGTPLAPDATWDDTAPVASLALTAVFTRGISRSFALQVDVWAHHFGGTPTYELVSMVKGPVDPLWNFAAPGTGPWFTAPNGENGALFRNNTRLAIDVDDVAFTVTFSVDGYTNTVTFASLGIPNGTVTSASLDSVNLLMHPPQLAAWQFKADFYNFYLSKDGTRIAGAQLGVNDPGQWVTAPWANNTFLLPAATDNGVYNSLDPTRRGGGRTFDPATQTRGQPYITAVWDNAASPQLQASEPLIDLVCSPNSGALVYARVVKERIDAVEIGVSDDKGHTWSLTSVTLVGSYCTSPSLQITPHEEISLVVYDGKVARWLLSEDFGRHWRNAGVFFTALPWSTTTTHPKHFIGTDEGSFLVTYNQAGHLKVQAFDVASAGAALGISDLGVVAGGFDAYPAIVVTPLNRVYIIWVDTGGVNEWHTDTFGVTPFVNDAPLISTTDLRPDMIYRPPGPTWFLFQEAATGDLRAFSTSNPPDYTADPPGAVTIDPINLRQYAAIDILPTGLPIVVYQDALRQVHTRVCIDALQNWQPA